MKSNLIDINGKKKKQIEIPSFFNSKIREDLIQKIVELKKTRQPYGPNPVAGNQYSASGKIRHRRHVWKTHYRQGISRIPRKIISARGSRFNWIGATIPSTRGGRRAHPPKVLSLISAGKINKKELRLAFLSALSATASSKWIEKRYSSIKKEDLKEFPLIVESKIYDLKTKELLASLKKILGKALFKIAVQKKEIRKGKGKLRGRKYKSNSGLLIVLGQKEEIKTTVFDVIKAKNLGIEDLAKGSPGRLTIYTEKAISDLEMKIGEKKKK